MCRKRSKLKLTEFCKTKCLIEKDNVPFYCLISVANLKKEHISNYRWTVGLNENTNLYLTINLYPQNKLKQYLSYN